MTDYEDRFWHSRDGLELHYRDYPAQGPDADPARPAVLCLHGLTRNARDYELLAPRLAAAGWHVLCPDMRGRGDSEYARDSASYRPAQYIEDVLALIEEAGLARFVAIGTSMGGLLVMELATLPAEDLAPDRLVGAVINDVGPWLEQAGMERIRDYTGQGRTYATWVHAARGLESVQGVAHPEQPLDFWIGKAKRLMTLSSNGRIAFDYDMKIAEPFLDLDLAEQKDMWPAWEALGGRPVLVLRGDLSDVLSLKTLAQMLERLPGAEAVTLPGVGHAPTLDESAAIEAIEGLLARVA
ncbi:alpha/beta hydrolase [Novosphingobium sp. YJ-S2-02]|uniref:Alpha/beta hydrolase n=1 Tax=Novosphingobium aureum TaxID=2792964 RepID=A0A931H9P7_9SPHN|nr:alpha/beta hydrolase [Novosphingobium aureum]MBH0111583.1 alpha/beta hydrolase [Novosphingobium aureum]